MELEYGLRLPFWPRTLLLTVKALNLDLGSLQGWQPSSGFQVGSVRDILLIHLSRTLHLIVPAFLLLFLLGLPLALVLFRKPAGFLDRLTTLFVPISSIPSWVLAILLILVFSIEVHLLPPGDMLDAGFNGTGVQLIFNQAKHMILPVLAIFLGLFFQCVYAWRTFLLLYADENYLELAKAKGLSQRVIDQRYVLRPTLPYIITSFSMLLVGLWQTTAALEYILRWQGIGWLYINSLPRLLEGGQQYPGDANIVVGVVVLFAYLLGATVLILDIVYAIVDPRVRIGNDEQTVGQAGSSFQAALQARQLSR
jgi:peptide/nickel transport system permease protein